MLLHAPLKDSERNKILLAVTEICTNYIRHSQTKPTQIQLNMSWSKTLFQLNIDDNGSPIPDDFEISSLDDLLAAEPNTSGYGMAILKSEFDLCDYQRFADQQKNSWQLSLFIADTSQRYKIAIIDDDALQLNMLNMYLEEHQTFLFDSPISAYDWLKHNHVDIIVSDVYMPEMDGLAFRERLRDISHLNTTPFIFLTADNQEALESNIFRSDIDDFILKPVQKTKILNVIERVIQRSHNLLLQAYTLLDSEVKQQLRKPIDAAHKNDRYRMASFSRSAHIGGGDCWHIETNQDKNNVHAILCDVMGHDIKACFNASRLHGFIQAMSTLPLCHLDAPSYSLQLFNATNTWLSKSAPEIITTMQCLSIEKEQIYLTNSAGLPPFIISQNGHLASLPITGPLLGLYSDPDFSPTPVMMDVGESILLFTDGLVEVPNKPEEEQQRLKHLSEQIQYAKRHHHPLAECIETFLEEIPLNDDISVILIEKIA
ncbi:SpoIIE family protein phosphatase [Marinomonas sp. C1424]|uniref:SpoIIE family protein phosphatase n=2 Tax=Marinomonas transparens TaxID=2795388 RepID=A0A934JR32_9GAMM|nr:SpoIIE family protein phosphatase [Marinomonas transparens]